MQLFDNINNKKKLTYIDLFCGLGGFRIAIEKISQEYKITPQCVFSSDIDPDAQKTYLENFGEQPEGDITKIAVESIPHHHLLLAGFPCQPFSICGDLKGFEDARGTLFFDIARILKHHKPYGFVLENVKQLSGHQQGKTLKIILSILEELGYYTTYKILNALDFGVPQKRERIFIIGCLDPIPFKWKMTKIPFKPLKEILETNVPWSYYASEKIRNNRIAKYKGKNYDEPTIWHENKAGNISAYPYSCAMRAGASYNYLLVDGERRLTEREMLRLQGFPDTYKLVGSYSTARKLVGNSVAIPCVAAVLRSFFEAVQNFETDRESYITQQKPIQLSLF